VNQSRSLRILFVTNIYPHPGNPVSGPFVMDQAESIRRLGHCVDVLHIMGYKSKLKYIEAVFRVFSQTLRCRYDIVHAHYGLSGFPALFRWRTPLVITLRGSDALVGKIQPLISRLVCRFADEVIGVSQEIASRFPGKVIPSGLDLEKFRPYDKKSARSRLSLPLNKRFILFPFSPKRKVKRFDLAKRAVERLRSFGHDAELLVVSDVAHQEMPWYYSAADAMILCSDSEGSPNSVKEALACNLPVVSADVGAVREIMNGIPGTKICKQDVDALARGLNEILRQEPSFVFESRSAMFRYDQRRIAESIIEVYERVLDQNLSSGKNQ
jgi:teichuronic acid biosynthesis glycosyltransferase TuaC